MNFKTLDFIQKIKDDLQDFFVSLSENTKIYYKAEAYSCSFLDLPAVIFTFGSVGEVVTKCKSFSLAPSLDFSIISKCSALNSKEGVKTALSLVSFLTKKYKLINFEIDDSKILENDSGSEDQKTLPRMFTGLKCSLGLRFDEFVNLEVKNE